MTAIVIINRAQKAMNRVTVKFFQEYNRYQLPVATENQSTELCYLGDFVDKEAFLCLTMTINHGVD